METKLGQKAKCCLPGCRRSGYVEYRGIRKKAHIICLQCMVNNSLSELREKIVSLPSVDSMVVSGEDIDEYEKNLDGWEDGMF